MKVHSYRITQPLLSLMRSALMNSSFFPKKDRYCSQAARLSKGKVLIAISFSANSVKGKAALQLSRDRRPGQSGSRSEALHGSYRASALGEKAFGGIIAMVSARANRR